MLQCVVGTKFYLNELYKRVELQDLFVFKVLFNQSIKNILVNNQEKLRNIIVLLKKHDSVLIIEKKDGKTDFYCDFCIVEINVCIVIFLITTFQSNLHAWSTYCANFYLPF